MATTKSRTTVAELAPGRLSATDKKLRAASRAAREKGVPAHIEVADDGWAVIVPDRPMAPLSVEKTRAAIDRVRR
jgi:hypothetical protein